MKRWPLFALLAASLAACGGRADRDPQSEPQTEPDPEPEPIPTSPPRPPSGLCSSHADCVVTPPCCAACGVLKSEQAIPLLRSELADYRRSCAASGEPCAECFRDTNPYLVPACGPRLCHVLDLSDPTLTECENASDCTLRANQCCAEQDSATFVAVSAAALDQIDLLLCDDYPPPANCRAEPPLHQAALCREGRCVSAFFNP